MLLTWLIVLVPLVLCLYLPFRYLVRQEWPKLRRAIYFPIAGQARWEHKTQRVRLLRRLNGVEILLHTADEREVHAVWLDPPGTARDAANGGQPPESPDAPCPTPAVLCLHANAMVLDDMVDWAHFYLQRGVAVMLITFWGYPDPSEPDDEPQGTPDSLLLDDPLCRCPTEETMYHDAEAALRYMTQVRRVTLDRALVHGLSIGGGVAASLGVRHPGLRVTLDQTFASLWEVSIHVGAGLYDQLLLPRSPRRLHPLVRCLQPCLLRLAAFVLLRMLFKIDGTSSSPSSSKQLCEQDRMDNLRKAAAMKGDLFAIFAEHDEMMDRSIAKRWAAARAPPPRPHARRTSLHSTALEDDLQTSCILTLHEDTMHFHYLLLRASPLARRPRARPAHIPARHCARGRIADFLYPDLA